MVVVAMACVHRRMWPQDDAKDKQATLGEVARRSSWRARPRYHGVERVLPIAPYRQWVTAYPNILRLAFARKPAAALELAKILVCEMFQGDSRSIEKSSSTTVVSPMTTLFA